MKSTIVITIKTISVVAVFFLLPKGLLFCVNNSGDYTYQMMKEMYSQSQPVDMVFLGASHVYRGITPKSLESVLGGNVFNLGSSSQSSISSYYLLREILGSTDVKTVVFEVTSRSMESEIDSQKAVRILSNYYKPSLNKQEYLSASFDHPIMLDDYFNVISMQKEIAVGIIKRVPFKKLFDPEYYTYAPNTDANEYYSGKGFVYSQVMMDRNSDIPNNEWIWEESQVDYNKIQTINDIITTCKQNGIEIIMISIPHHESMTLYNFNYQQAVNCFSKIAKEQEIPYWDFNLLKNSYLYLPDYMYKDFNHLNGEGADIFSKFFAEIYQDYKAGEDVDKYFFDTYNEKLTEIHGIKGLMLYSKTLADGTVAISATPVAKDVKTVEYKFRVVDGQNKIVFETPYIATNEYLFNAPMAGKYNAYVFAREAGGQDYQAVRKISMAIN